MMAFDFSILAAGGFALDPSGLLEMLPQAAVRLAAATFCGVVFGYERERRGKPAGMKTNALICIGATTYMWAGHAILAMEGGAGDPTRMASQIVTGIGFLGAGSIMRAGETVTGLTSAATIWFMGAVGVLIGCDLPALGIGLTLAALLVVLALRALEFRLFTGEFCIDCTITVAAGDVPSVEAVRKILGAALSSPEPLVERRDGDLVAIHARGCDPRVARGDIIRSLWAVPGVREIRQNR